MTGEALYERYKEALKRGHVASLQGRLAEALAAYAEAATIAPERATPHTSAGTALLRRKRAADALGQYDIALGLAPGDEAALLGRAEALAALDRRPEAADAFDAVAEVRAQAGRLADAVDAARRALELAEGRERRRTLRRLIERLRDEDQGEPGRLAMERALGVLDGSVVTGPEVAMGGEPGAGPEAGASPGAEPEPPARRGPLDRELPPDLDLAQLDRDAEAATDAGDAAAAIERLLDLAAARRRDGRPDATFDACYLGLSIVPDHVALHLALVELYDERGWRTLASDKLALVERLVTLDGDEAVLAEVAAARAARA